MVSLSAVVNFHEQCSMFWYNIDVSDMSMFGKMCAKRDEIHAIARKRKAERLWTFGSCARGEELSES